jgi:hypothetical protein
MLQQDIAWKANISMSTIKDANGLQLMNVPMVIIKKRHFAKIIISVTMVYGS